MSESLKPPPIAELYERNADYWAAIRGAPSPLPERKYLDRLLGLRPEGSPVLDVGCGTGQPIAAYLVSKGARVCGADVATSMIAKARNTLPDQEWVVADMRSLELSRRFGALIAWDSFFHLSQSDQRKTLPRFREHLLPGGVLLMTSGPAPGEQIGALNGELLFHASLSPEEYGSILTNLGFRDIEFTPNDPECGNHSVWLARLPMDPIPSR